MPSGRGLPYTVFIESAPGSLDSANSSISNSRSKINTYTRLATEASRRRKRTVNSPASRLVGWSSNHALYPSNTIPLEVDIRHRPSISPVVDSLNCGNVHVDETAHRILQYFLTFTMPSRFSLVVTNIAGFTALLPGDYDIAEDQIRQAFQADNNLHFNALLASNAGRMQGMSKVRDLPQHQPPGYALQAVRTLQRVLQHGRVTEMLILDVCLLSLWEYHAAGNVYSTALWPMMKDLAIRCGGLAQCDAYVAYKTMSFDFLFCILDLKAPVYNFEAFPDILRSGLRQVDATVLSELSPRVQVMYSNLTLYLRLWKSCRFFQSHTLTKARQTILHHRAQISHYYATSLNSLSPTKQYEDKAFKGDLVYHELRAIGILIWVWHVVSKCASMSNSLLMELLALHKQKLTDAECVLAGTNWRIPVDVLLWNLCVSQMHGCQETPWIRVRLSELLRIFGCANQPELNNRLSHMLPLIEMDDEAGYFRIFAA